MENVNEQCKGCKHQDKRYQGQVRHLPCVIHGIFPPIHCKDKDLDFDQTVYMKSKERDIIETISDLNNSAEYHDDRLVKAAKAVIKESCRCMNPEFCNYNESTSPCTETMHNMCNLLYRENNKTD